MFVRTTLSKSSVTLRPTWLHSESGLWISSEGCPAVGGGVSLQGDNTLKAALSHPHCFLIHTAPPKPPSPILAFLQLVSPGNEHEHVCLTVCVVTRSMDIFYSDTDLIFEKAMRKVSRSHTFPPKSLLSNSDCIIFSIYW